MNKFILMNNIRKYLEVFLYFKRDMLIPGLFEGLYTSWKYANIFKVFSAFYE